MSKTPVILCFGDSNTHGTLPMKSVLDLDQLITKIHQMPCGPKIGTKPKILLVALPPVLERGFAADALIGAAPKSRELAVHYDKIAKDAGVEFLDAGTVTSADPLDGVHFSAESHKMLGVAIAEKLKQMFEQ